MFSSLKYDLLIKSKRNFKNYKILFMEQLEKLILKGDLNDHEARVYGEIWGKKLK